MRIMTRIRIRMNSDHDKERDEDNDKHGHSIRRSIRIRIRIRPRPRMISIGISMMVRVGGWRDVLKCLIISIECGLAPSPLWDCDPFYYAFHPSLSLVSSAAFDFVALLYLEKGSGV